MTVKFDCENTIGIKYNNYYNISVEAVRCSLVGVGHRLIW